MLLRGNAYVILTALGMGYHAGAWEPVRQIVGWSLSDKLYTTLIINALEYRG